MVAQAAVLTPAPAPVSDWHTASVGRGNVVLLLPVSGPLASAGSAVRDGFLAVQPAAQVYDTLGTPDGTVEAARRAAAEGAALLVGPLRKEDAVALAVNGGVNLPVLALNYLDPSTPVPAGFWQFGLSADDEAIAAAEDASARGLRRAIAFVPSGDWGTHLLAAFRERFTALGGTVVDAAQYASGTQDFSAPIKSMLKIDASDARYNSVTATLGFKPEFEQRRRDDVDFVFLGARAAQARLIAPQFRYWRAERLPIYATSSINDGTPDMDLAGMRFCDVPALLATPDGGSTSAPSPSSAAPDIQRLNALGRDAAQLAAGLQDNRLGAETSLNGATGTLVVENGVVHRHLACAEMLVGGVRPLGAADR